MNIIAPFPRAERRRIEKAIHKSTCKHHVRRLTAVLMLATNYTMRNRHMLLIGGVPAYAIGSGVNRHDIVLMVQGDLLVVDVGV